MKHFYGPSNTMPSIYDTKVQYVQEDLSKPLIPVQFKEVERIVGMFLYYAQAIDNTMAHMMHHLGSQKRKVTQPLMQAVAHFLNYAASNLIAKNMVYKNDMSDKIDSDAVYLVCLDARSRAGGYHYLGNVDSNLFNGPIYILVTIIEKIRNFTFTRMMVPNGYNAVCVEYVFLLLLVNCIGIDIRLIGGVLDFVVVDKYIQSIFDSCTLCS